MHLKHLQLIQFKNYEKAQVAFSGEINCFLGINGSGKTNLLDAIHYLSLTKSAFNSVDMQNIQHDQSFFSMKGHFEKAGKTVEIQCILEAKKKKQVLNNGKAYDKMSEHVGLLPVVMIAPDDTTLIKEGSEERRKFFDSLLSQLDKNYLLQLMRYQHFLKQRNALIKQFAEQDRMDKSLLEPYDLELIGLSKWLFQEREAFIDRFKPFLLHHYEEISGNREQVAIRYESQVRQSDFENHFHNCLKKDLLLKRTNAGIHKDDFVFTIDGYPLKKFGSQGQQKSFLIALKLAQFQVFKEETGTKPLLLLDDIFDKLDDFRIGKMMDLVADHAFGQLFITDARPERTKKIMQDINADIAYFHIEEGNVSRLKDE
ncbi:DNA replication and repair protein RecF [Echinicola strongylocentroti]|uniref:DNA replication and repair protein RecF n=1 Tax=Echinicola strongylocentroti TaxID=1795355 RepID=A0A2Z4IJU1_9BACT|nr:DNA replication/repair protein RecF [Echinicola strongylocentroti]AWW30798.1 DNA replication and repair protein RecF [Echinicola strongylocentroti]